MDIEKIVLMLNSCIKKIIEKSFTDQEQLSVSYAVEFALIIIGERANEVIKEVGGFVAQNLDLFIAMLKQQNMEYDAEKIKTDEAYEGKLFRQLFGKCTIGKNLLDLNFFRNNLKHKFGLLSQEHHLKFSSFEYQLPNIRNFLDEARKVFRSSEDKNELVKNLFLSTGIKPIDFTLIQDIRTTFEAKKEKKLRLTFEEQQAKVLKRLNSIEEIAKSLENFSKKLQTELSSSGQQKNVTPLYATAMCLTAIGESATALIYLRKNEKIDLSIKELFKPYNNILNYFSGVVTELTHSAQALPTFQKLAKTAEKFLEKLPELLKLKPQIQDLQPPASIEASSSSASHVEEEASTSVSPASVSMIESVLDRSSPVFPPLSEPETPRKRALLATTSQPTDQPVAGEDPSAPKKAKR